MIFKDCVKYKPKDRNSALHVPGNNTTGSRYMYLLLSKSFHSFALSLQLYMTRGFLCNFSTEIHVSYSMGVLGYVSHHEQHVSSHTYYSKTKLFSKAIC